MRVETKFDLGQTVHVYARRKHELFDPCPDCGGRGRVTFQPVAPDREPGTTYCPNPECRHGRVRSVWHDLWEYAGEALIGSFEVRKFDVGLAPSHFNKDEERYMLDTTGIGSGTVYVFDGAQWSHTNLYATRAEGEAWADEQNEPLRAEALEKRARLSDEVLA